MSALTELALRLTGAIALITFGLLLIFIGSFFKLFLLVCVLLLIAWLIKRIITNKRRSVFKEKF